jgi:hypothetical protein
VVLSVFFLSIAEDLIMATYRAKCWLGSSSGYQELEVQSNTFYGAKEQFERIYGAEQIINLREVRSGSSSSSSSGDVGGYLVLGAILFGIWLLVEYWWIVIPISVIIGLLVWYGSRD